MGLFETAIRIGAVKNGVPSLTETANVLVDSGATYTTLPTELLERAGATRLGSVPVQLANGVFVEKPCGAALIEVQGRVVNVTVLFGQPGDFALLGATTLEQAGFAVDPVGRRLVAVSAIQA